MGMEKLPIMSRRAAFLTVAVLNVIPKHAVLASAESSATIVIARTGLQIFITRPTVTAITKPLMIDPPSTV